MPGLFFRSKPQITPGPETSSSDKDDKKRDKKAQRDARASKKKERQTDPPPPSLPPRPSRASLPPRHTRLHSDPSTLSLNQIGSSALVPVSSPPLIHHSPQNASVTPHHPAQQSTHLSPRPARFPYHSRHAASTSALPLYPNPLQQDSVENDHNKASWNVLSDRMSTIITAFDAGDEHADLDLPAPPLPNHTSDDAHEPPASRSLALIRFPARSPVKKPQQPKSTPPIAKVHLYSNSRLPPSLAPLRLYVPTYPLLCLAAYHSLHVYTPHTRKATSLARSASTMTHIPSSFLHTTKPTTLTTTTLDTSRVIIIAIRGSYSFSDWAVNFRPSPTPPTGFLEDEGNLVHAGFLGVAKAMMAPVVEKLRKILQGKAERKGMSLCFCGHSAGGAVASLLYMHVMARTGVQSELRDVSSNFRRIHCVTFGAPPVSLLPLQKPEPPPPSSRPSGNGGPAPESTQIRRLRKSIFFAFINEGDPVVRADMAVMRSLVSLYASPAPITMASTPPLTGNPIHPGPTWPIPPGTLSLGGRLVLLRPSSTSSAAVPTSARGAKQKIPGLKAKGASAGAATAENNAKEKVTASTIVDADLRGVVFGDLGMHSMQLYAERIESLAVGAVTGR